MVRGVSCCFLEVGTARIQRCLTPLKIIVGAWCVFGYLSRDEDRSVKMDSILRTKDVPNVVGFARTTLRRPVKSGDFPQPVRLGGAGSRAVGWRSGDVERWLAERQSV